MERVRIGLVGCGLFGESHLWAYRAVSRAEVTAVYDLSFVRATEVAQRFGIPRVCSNLEQLCESPVDAVDVVTSEATHLEPVLAAFRQGKHVFVEKPFATDLNHCDQMIQAARAAGRILMAGHILRFETKYVLLKQEVESGRLGKIVSMSARRNRPKSLWERYRRTHLALLNSIHDVDLMLWYAGGRVHRVRGYHRKITGGSNPDAFWGVLEFDHGPLGIVEAVWSLPPAAGVALDDSFELIGERGVGSLQLFPGSLTFWRAEGFEAPDISYEPRLRGAAHGALREELAYFCECVRAGREPQVITPREAKNSVRVALALVQSAETDRDVEIEVWD